MKTAVASNTRPDLGALSVNPTPEAALARQSDLIKKSAKAAAELLRALPAEHELSELKNWKESKLKCLKIIKFLKEAQKQSYFVEVRYSLSAEQKAVFNLLLTASQSFSKAHDTFKLAKILSEINQLSAVVALGASAKVLNLVIPEYQKTFEKLLQNSDCAGS